MKVAVKLLGNGLWLGGEIYLRNLFRSIKYTKRSTIDVCLFTDNQESSLDKYTSSTNVTNVIHYQTPQRWTARWFVNGVFKRLLLIDGLAGKVLKDNGVRVFFGPSLLLKYPGVATLSWLPDFQHVHLPDMFAESEIASRNEQFLKTAAVTNRVVVLSEAVKNDFQSFAPQYINKVRVIPPISYIPESVYACDPKSVISIYDLPERFAYLPNQFWKHKNHEAVFRALRILKDRGLRVPLVCTGYAEDYRHQGYFAELWLKASRWGVRDCIFYLGVVPREHVLLLMRQSACVVNPSMFEGWGFSVDEAKSLGKRVVVSDIPAHREQDPVAALYFDPMDSEELANQLSRAWIGYDPRAEINLQYEVKEIQRDRLAAFGEQFISVCREVSRESTL